MQLIVARENRLYLYYRKGKIGNSPRADDKLEEWENVNDAIREFAKLFEELTGDQFEPWEREKKIHKKNMKFFPIDIVCALFTSWNKVFLVFRLFSFKYKRCGEL